MLKTTSGGLLTTAQYVDLSTEGSGILPVVNGGTGTNTLTQYGVLFGNGTSALGATTAGSNGQLLLGVTSSAPVFATMSGDITITNGGVTTIGADTVALATDTTGDFVVNITAGNGLSSPGATTGENISHTLSIDATTTGTTTTLSSNSGIEATAAGIRLLGGCSDNEVLAWDSGGSTWGCTTVAGIGAGDINTVGNITSGDAFTGSDLANRLVFEGSMTTQNANDIEITAVDRLRLSRR